MRTILRGLYLGSGALGAILIAAIGVLALWQIVARLLHIVVDITDISGYCFSAATFLALAYTLGDGGHIRVTMLVQSLQSRSRLVAELWCCAFGTLICGYFTYQAAILVYQSFIFGEKTQGLWVLPLWIPQLGLVVGLGILTIALVDEGAQVLASKTPRDEGDKESAAALAAAGQLASRTDTGRPR